MKYSAYLPCFNNRATIRAAAESVIAQIPAPTEVLLTDDGSTDGSAEVVADLPVRVLRSEENLGRGAVRARAMAETQHEFVLCCDATNTLPPNFAERALRIFADPRVGAAFGPIRDLTPRGVSGRWRARHLFKQDTRALRENRRATLGTYGAMVRKSAVARAGGFDTTLRHSEDAELSARLRAASYDVVFDPDLVTYSNVHNSLGEVLERYWRWTVGPDEEFSPAGIFRHAWYAVRTLAAADLQQRDHAAACVSVGLPFFMLGKTIGRRLTGARQRSRVRGAA